jgi:hypothetical protein
MFIIVNITVYNTVIYLVNNTSYIGNQYYRSFSIDYQYMLCYWLNKLLYYWKHNGTAAIKVLLYIFVSLLMDSYFYSTAVR